MNQCPSCGTSLPENAVLCVQCGFHLQAGKRLTTESETPETPVEVVPAAAGSAKTANPYQSPAAEPKGLFDKGLLRQNYDLPTRVSFLEDRVRELERRVDSTWLVSPNFFMRMLAVWGFVMLGYALMWSTIFGLMVVLRGGF